MKKLIFLAIIGLCLSCTSSRIVKPLGKNEKEVGLSLGGPLVHFSDLVIPIPFTSLHYAQGVTDDVTAFGGLHTTSLIAGVIQIDAGAVVNVLSEEKYYFGLSTTPSIHFMTDIWEYNSKLFPTIDINAYRTYNARGSFFYFGMTNWFDLAKYQAHGEPNAHKWLFAPHFGHTAIRKKWNINIELKYLAPNVSNQKLVVDYIKPFGDKGTLGLYLGFNYRF
ncbi:MAG: hypothetical protein KGZ97_07350 [Bacteroidetes bacterium]|nr:hypothetical protein [Bacteroidota bacterium]